MRSMKAISLWEPWASAMATGHKRNETRSWGTDYRGDLLICAAKRVPSPDELLLLADVLGNLQITPGCAVCVVELYDMKSTNAIGSKIAGTDEWYLGDYSPGRFAWLTRNVRRIPPTPWRGKQGLWTLTPDEIKQLPGV